MMWMHDSDRILSMVEWRSFFVQEEVTAELGAVLDHISFGAEMMIHCILIRKVCKYNKETLLESYRKHRGWKIKKKK